MNETTLTTLALAILLMMFGGCGAQDGNDGGAPRGSVGGLVFDNQTQNEIGIIEVAFDGQKEFSFLVLGPGAKATLMGRIASVRGVPQVQYTHGLIGDPSIRADLERVDYEGGLDHLVLRLQPDETWVLIGQLDGAEVFRAEEVSRVDVPATNDE